MAQNFSTKRQETQITKILGGRISDYGSIDCGGRFVYPFDQKLQDRKKDVDVSRIGSISGSTNKRKISPIVSDRVGKQVKIYSRNRILPTGSVISRSSSPNSSTGFGSIESCSVAAESERHIFPVESFHDQEIENEGEYVGARNLSKSKWAFEDSPIIESDVSNSSSESGEFKQEAFERNVEVSSFSGDIVALTEKVSL
ncbi:hypothetical protein L1987_66837 [Smallanthus sonchifolius]|uniref:Uncharacterized protein n=1 Tax=Smallanthus sonchifolius TaxID=185202 RepID=A0ACB9BYL3_9ASTR|nr:hypothetical protein L1987_66837 [Smallanthus sonchifolius]